MFNPYYKIVILNKIKGDLNTSFSSNTSLENAVNTLFGAWNKKRKKMVFRTCLCLLFGLIPAHLLFDQQRI
jgi:hypothetical protein